ncbi:excinuclease ABC, B subunit [Deferribacter desulfuricans SSM1]|uniref:UvrABC system protein B n=1 Tax=Deferribacter desulfuricans (strain DSM 14783 / JCM 11476 / NBRC 101012 / SSM1) TaxID=639282 RepID=D3PC20_DEFDS|nr:excinuclease ABC subunit UvrB [Deferribacter desulfuricans]BAI80143.1 excinuclease ABC, B subunit [Deferribacter desulfuricans SSM1]
MSFILKSDYKAEGDQPKAIKEIVENFKKGINKQVLLGVTGSGKTFTMANVIKELNVPTLIISHNKTLAAQLFGEFKNFFPDNAVEYFVSYYDYYQPEAYLPASDVYIEKDSSINEHIDRMRHSATRSLLERRDVVIVASVSCIYGLGSPEAYYGKLVSLEVGDEVEIESVLSKLIEIQYERNDYDFHRGTFRLKGDILEVFPSHEDSVAYRIEFFGDEVDAISEFDPVTGKTIRNRAKIAIYPNTHYVTANVPMEEAIKQIKMDLIKRVEYFESEGKLIEAQRLQQRVMHDIEMLKETGHCKGIENYSRYFEGRESGETPPTLLNYLPEDALIIIDESHITIPQIKGMYHGDRSRKMNLVEYGFRLPAALDNRPLTFEEFYEKAKRILYVSATPGDFEINDSDGVIIEQIVRPTGLIDPKIEVRPAKTQVDDLYKEILNTTKRNERVMVTTLTKRMAEDLTSYYKELGIRVEYLHSEIDTLERIKIIRDLRLGKFDVLVGINLLREGLDIPEVSLIAILDADKEGFLRSDKALIQTVGRAARNVNGRAIFYADKMTDSMKRAIEETERRRKIQEEYNKKHNITPETIKSKINNILETIYEKDYYTVDIDDELGLNLTGNRKKDIETIEKAMYKAAEDYDFEKAAKLRDLLFEYKGVKSEKS